MFRWSSLQLARIFGIRIGVNASWFLILFLFVFLLSDSFSSTLGDRSGLAYVTAALAAVLFFGSIVLHELGHALAARRCGIEVSGIDLFFFGGIMKMNRDTDSPGAEFKVAVAGPLVTLGIVVIGTALGIAIAGPSDFWNAAWLKHQEDTNIVVVLVSFLVTMNLGLLAFNLVPAFPLDGGRIARAIAWKVTNNRAKATRFAARIGQAFAYVLIGFGIFLAIQPGRLIDGLWFIALGWLLGQAARAAVLQNEFVEKLAGITVADIMDAEPVMVPADLSLRRAWEEFFLRYYGFDWFAVVESDHRYIGVLRRGEVQDTAEGPRSEAPVRTFLHTEEGELSVPLETPLESLLASESLRTHGALMALDKAGRLRGIVTLQQVSRALQSRLDTAVAPRV